MKRWSKLQRDLFNVIDEDSGFMLHCTKYRMVGSRSTDPNIPRYWITIGKEIVWDFPKSGTDYQKYNMYLTIPDISNAIREYINCPKDKVKLMTDEYGLYNILRQYDKRFKKESK